MASLTLASPCITSTIFNSETIISSNNRRDESFSSYLNLIRESLTKEVTDSGDDTPTTMRISIGKNQGEDGELDIFRAEKYFSGIMDHGDISNHIEALVLEKSDPVSRPYKKEGKMSLKSISMTESSTCSETSANSRNTLLRDHRRKGRRSRRLLGVFWCSCSGKDATRVEEELNGNKKQELIVKRSSFANKIEDGLTFMTLSSQMAAARMTIQKETFGPSFIEEGVMVSSTLRKSLTLLTPPLATKQEQEEEEDDDDDDDFQSESSSDLFEIDSLSINGNPLFRPETGYEPSEASIDWSVTTASAGNDERRLDIDGEKRPSKSSKHSMLLGCASEKAVNVTTENYSKKAPERLSSVNNYEQMIRFESLPPLLRYHASQAVQSRHSLDFTHGGL